MMDGFVLSSDWGKWAEEQEKAYSTKWEKGYTFIEPASGTVCWFCERDKWEHDLVIPSNSLLAKVVSIWPYRLKDVAFLCKGYEPEIVVNYIRINDFRDKEEIDGNYICFNDVEIVRLNPLDAIERIEEFRKCFEDEEFLKSLPTLLEKITNAAKKITKRKKTKKTN